MVIHEAKNGRYSFSVSDLGDINRFRLDGLELVNEVPIYSCLHIDYSRKNPECTPFDSLLVDAFHADPGGISFSKVFRHPVLGIEITVDYFIEWGDDGIKIGAFLRKRMDNIRFGFVLPVHDASFYNVEQPHPVINFSRFWQRRWTDQTYLDIPMVKLSHEKTNIYAALPIDYNSQFFLHEQNGQSCCKTSVNSLHSMCIEIQLFSDEKEHRDAYLHKYPQSDSFVLFWKTIVKKITVVHGISVSWDVAWNAETIKFDKANAATVEPAIEKISSELSKCPWKLSEIGVVEIILATNIENPKTKDPLLGFRYQSIIVLDANAPDLWLVETVHHEIFHFLESQATDEVIKEWDRHTDVPIFLTNDKGFFEESCILYSKMMADPSFIESLAGELEDVHARCKLIEKICHDTTGAFLDWKSTMKSTFNLSHEGTALAAASLKSVIEQRKSANQTTLICGMDGCGLSLLKRYFEHNDVPIVDEPLQIPSVSFHKLDHPAHLKELCDKFESNVLFMVRHPQYHIWISHKKSPKNDLKDVVPFELQRWIDINSSVLGSEFVYTILKYEDLLMDDSSIIQRVFKFTGCEIKHFESFIDYDLDNDMQPLPYVKQMITKLRDNDIMTKTRYLGVY